MKKRILLGLIVVAAVGAGLFLADPVRRIQLMGRLRNEKFYRDMPAHFWLEAIEGADGNQRYEAILALGREPDAIPALAGRLKDAVPFLRHLAAVELARFGPEAQAAVPALTQMLTDDDRSCRQAAKDALERINASRPDNDAGVLARIETAPLTTAEAMHSLDWPQWRGPHRDGIAGDRGLLTVRPEGGPRVVWRAKTGAGFSSPAVAEGRVYLLVQDGDREAVVCWNADSGSELWRHRYPALFSNPEAGVGPHATPTIAGDRVYTVGATGQFFCLNAATGTVVWSHDLLKEFDVANQEYGVSFSPLIEGNLVVTMPGGTNGKSVAAFDCKDGRLIWSTGDERAGYSSPIAATLAGRRQLVVLTAEAVHGLAPEDGKPFWRFPWPSFKDCNVATPIAVGNYVFVSTGYNKGCALLEISPSPQPSPPGGEGRVRGGFQARPVYEHNRMRNHFSTCVLFQEHLYGFDESFLVCMELRTGKILWKKRGFGRGSLLIADSRLIVLGEHGNLALAEASPADYRELSACKLLGDKCWSMPASAHGKLYVRDEEQILCLDVRNQQ